MFTILRINTCVQAERRCSKLEDVSIAKLKSSSKFFISCALADDCLFWIAAITAHAVLYSIKQITNNTTVALGVVTHSVALAGDVCADTESALSVPALVKHRAKELKIKRWLTYVHKLNKETKLFRNDPDLFGKEPHSHVEVCFRYGQDRLMVHQNKCLPIYIAFLRDVPVQLAKVGARVANSISMLTDLVHVSSLAAGITAGALGIVGACLQIVQGAVVYCKGVAAIRAARHFLEKVGELYLEKMPDVLGLMENQANPVTLLGVNQAGIDCWQRLSLEKRQHVQQLYATVCAHLINNHQSEVKSQEIVVYRAKVRIIYGTLSLVLGITSLALLITGVGGIAVGVSLLIVGAVLGVGWLSYAIYQSQEKWLNTQNKAIANAWELFQVKKVILFGLNLNSLESIVKSNKNAGQNSLLLAVMLKMHLINYIDKSEKGELLPVADLNEEQLTCRVCRYAAHFVLDKAGMQEQDRLGLEKSIKITLKTIDFIRLYLTKNAGRIKWLAEGEGKKH